MSTETTGPGRGGHRTRPTACLRRTFAAELTAGDGRTVDVRVVPFGEVARVGGPAGLAEPYDEEWMPGVFDHQLNAANRVLANFEHQRGASAASSGTALTLRAAGRRVPRLVPAARNPRRRQDADAGTRGRSWPASRSRRVAVKNGPDGGRCGAAREGEPARRSRSAARAPSRGAQVLAVREDTATPDCRRGAVAGRHGPGARRAVASPGDRSTRPLPGAPRRDGHPALSAAPPMDGTRQPEHNTSSEE